MVVTREQVEEKSKVGCTRFCVVCPNRIDVFASAGGHSLLRLVLAICQIKGWKMIIMDVKDAFLIYA